MNDKRQGASHPAPPPKPSQANITVIQVSGGRSPSTAQITSGDKLPPCRSREVKVDGRLKVLNKQDARGRYLDDDGLPIATTFVNIAVARRRSVNSVPLSDLPWDFMLAGEPGSGKKTSLLYKIKATARLLRNLW